jgi:hypothetical protein
VEGLEEGEVGELSTGAVDWFLAQETAAGNCLVGVNFKVTILFIGLFMLLLKMLTPLYLSTTPPMWGILAFPQRTCVNLTL